MPTRTFASGEEYRFGFNGKENDKDFGDQLIQDYGFRLYNPAIGKFLSVDPLAPEYPFYTPYQFAGNTPIQAIDLDGLEPFRATDGMLLYRVKKNQGPTQIAKDLNDNYSFLGSDVNGSAPLTINYQSIVRSYWNLKNYYAHINPKDRNNKWAEQYKHLNMNEGDIIDISFWDGYNYKEVKGVAIHVNELRREYEKLLENISLANDEILRKEGIISEYERMMTSNGIGGGKSDITSGRVGNNIGLNTYNNAIRREITSLRAQIVEQERQGDDLLKEIRERARKAINYIKKNVTDIQE